MKPSLVVTVALACLLAACGGRGEPAPVTQAVAVEARAEAPAETPLPAGWPGFDTLRADSRDRLFDECMGRASVISMQQYAAPAGITRRRSRPATASRRCGTLRRRMARPRIARASSRPSTG